MIIVAGTLRVDPATRQATRAAMEKMIEASRAEDGCIEYSYAADVLYAGLVRVYEVWRDKPALQAHFKMPHLDEWRAAWPTMGVSGRKLQLFEISAVSPL